MPSRKRPSQEHPWVAVDVVVFTIEAGELEALLVKIKRGPCAGQWAFPGGLVGLGESTEEAARRELSEKTGVTDIYLDQLYTFGDPERNPVHRVVSVAYFALIPRRGAWLRATPKYADMAWRPVNGLPPLAYDHNQMARVALDRLRAKLGYTNIAWSLLEESFTLSELQEVYEVILGTPLDRRNFRKKILSLGLVKKARGMRRGAHRPAQLYSFASREPLITDSL